MRSIRLLFGIALFAISNLTYGQNTSTVDQTGAAKNADVTQQGQQLRSLVRQSGATGPSGATVVQQGGNATVGNNSTVIQTNNSTGTNTAMVSQTQTGSGANSVSLTQTNTGATTNSATVSQSGQNLNATSLQNGAGHTLNIVQTGDGSNAITNQQTTGNLISVTQAAGSAGSPNQVYIQQLSGDNKVYATQFGATTQGNGLTVTQQTGNMNEVGTSTNPFYQSGNGNTATITQQGGGLNKVFSFSQSSGATALITQSGTSGLVQNVTQNGPSSMTVSQLTGSFSNSVVNVTQTGTIGNSGNTLNIMQGGAVNANNLVISFTQNGTGAVGNTATITQTGRANEFANSRQVGQNNSLTVVQIGNGTGNGMNTIGRPVTTVRQGIHQDGNNNTAVISQTATSVIGNKVFEVVQGGDNNNLVINQNGRGHTILPMKAYGNFNSLTINQSGNIAGDNGNTIGVLIGTTGAASNSNQVLITQTGRNNTLGGNNPTQGGLVIQGNSNSVTIGQSSNVNLDNSANMNLVGNSNTVSLTQTGGNNSLGTGGATTSRGLSVTGNGNTVNISQNQTGSTINQINAGIVGNTNSVSLTQNGSGNTIGTGGGAATRGLTITGDLNLADVSQTGNNNVATATITGNSNTLLVGQTGNTNLASVTQTTNNSFITLTQDGADVATLKQLGAGTANKIYLSQEGTTGINTATITQNGSFNYVGGLNTSYAAPGVARQFGLGGNTATINQTYTGAGPVGQVTLFQQNGSNNVLNVTQNQ